MPKGNTTTISVVSFTADWNAGLPIALLCQAYSISKDQVVRLRDLWNLPLRHDRRKRKRQAGHDSDPTPEEIHLRCLEVQATWSDRMRQERYWEKHRDWVVPNVDIFSEGIAWPDEPEVPEDD